MEQNTISKAQVLRIVQEVLDDKYGTGKDIATALRIAKALGLRQWELAELNWDKA